MENNQTSGEQRVTSSMGKVGGKRIYDQLKPETNGRHVPWEFQDEWTKTIYKNLALSVFVTMRDLKAVSPEEMWHELFGDEPMPAVDIVGIEKLSDNTFKITVADDGEN